MPFDPTLPATGSPLDSAQMRGQLTALKALIDSVFQNLSTQVDTTNTLPPGEQAAVSISVNGSTLHFTFSIPQGNDGQQGPQGEQGPPGEVSVSDLNSAISAVLAQTSHISNAVSQLGMSADPSYQQWQMQAILDKLDELIAALRRL